MKRIRLLLLTVLSIFLASCTLATKNDIARIQKALQENTQTSEVQRKELRKQLMILQVRVPKKRSLADKLVTHPYRTGFGLEFLLVGGFAFLAARRLNSQPDVDGDLDYKDVQSLSFARRILDMVISRNVHKRPPPDPPEPGDGPRLRVVK